MIILDTHIWVWWLNGELVKLGPEQIEKIERSERIAVSSISCFEVAWLVQHNRIVLNCSLAEWFTMALDGSNVDLVSITPQIAEMAVKLTEHHSDPQDRLIMATAIVNQSLILSNDSKFMLYAELKDLLVSK